MSKIFLNQEPRGRPTRYEWEIAFSIEGSLGVAVISWATFPWRFPEQVMIGKLAKADGTYLKELNKLIKVDLLILDDFGLQAFDHHARETLMDIIDERQNKTSTIITSQIPVTSWYDIIREGAIADAILVR